MIGWFPASEIIIVHAGKIIVNEGIGMERLNGNRRWLRVDGTAERFMDGEQEHGPQPFAAGFERVAHGPVEAVGAGVGGRQVARKVGRDPISE